jgi:hypothetical protein
VLLEDSSTDNLFFNLLLLLTPLEVSTTIGSGYCSLMEGDPAC